MSYDSDIYDPEKLKMNRSTPIIAHGDGAYLKIRRVVTGWIYEYYNYNDNTNYIIPSHTQYVPCLIGDLDVFINSEEKII